MEELVFIGVVWYFEEIEAGRNIVDQDGRRTSPSSVTVERMAIERKSMRKSMFINGDSVKEHALQAGDRIQIASSKFTYKIED